MDVQKKLVHGGLEPCHANLIFDIPTRRIQLYTLHMEGIQLARATFFQK